jgi:acetyl esterase
MLDQLAALGGLPLEQMTPTEARQMVLAARVADVPREDVVSVVDRTIPGPAGEIPVRIYRPVDKGALPVLVYFHGGGWVLGDLEGVDVPLRAIANRAGCAIVSVDYRLAPEHKFPAAADDCYAVARWVAENAASLGVDPSRIAIGGDSAGGNLTAVVALMARDRGGPRFVHQLLVYPVTNFDFTTPSYDENADGYFLTKAAMVWFWNHYLRDETDGAHPHASPYQASDLSNLPAAFVITAEYDPLRDEGEAYADRLRQAGNQVELRRYDGMIHGFFTMGNVLDQGQVVVEDAAERLRQAFA